MRGLLEWGVDPHSHRNGIPTLILASSNGDVGIMLMMLDVGVDSDMSVAVRRAACYGQDNLEILLRRGTEKTDPDTLFLNNFIPKWKNYK